MRYRSGRRAARGRGAGGARPAAVALALAALLAAPAAAPAPLYRWTDASGAVVYSDQPPPAPPPGGTEVILDAVPTYRAPTLRPSYQPPPEDQDHPPSADAARPEPAPKERYTCAQAKRYLAIHTPPPGERRTLYEPNPDGTFKVLDGKDVAGMRDAWKAVVSRACSGAGGGSGAANGSASGPAPGG